MMYYAGCHIHHKKNMYRIELFNEIIIMMIIYHFMIFSDFVPHLMIQFTMGYSYLGFLVLLITVNLSYSVYETYLQWKRRKHTSMKHASLRFKYGRYNLDGKNYSKRYDDK